MVCLLFIIVIVIVMVETCVTYYCNLFNFYLIFVFSLFIHLDLRLWTLYSSSFFFLNLYIGFSVCFVLINYLLFFITSSVIQSELIHFWFSFFLNINQLNLDSVEFFNNFKYSIELYFLSFNGYSVSVCVFVFLY